MLLEKLKKSKLYIGIALVIQCFAFVIAALISFGKRREESGALLAVAAISGAIGAYLIAIDTLDDEDVYGDFSNHFDDFDFDDDDFNGYYDSDIIEHEIVKSEPEDPSDDFSLEG